MRWRCCDVTWMRIISETRRETRWISGFIRKTCVWSHSAETVTALRSASAVIMKCVSSTALRSRCESVHTSETHLCSSVLGAAEKTLTFLCKMVPCLQLIISRQSECKTFERIWILISRRLIRTLPSAHIMESGCFDLAESRWGARIRRVFELIWERKSSFSLLIVFCRRLWSLWRHNSDSVKYSGCGPGS